MSLSRFHAAQADCDFGSDTALLEIRAGTKRNHWIWYIFPQLAGLGRSATARAYAVRDFTEACAYVRDPVLRDRYLEIARAVNEQLARGTSVERLMGSRLDALKLTSSVTLFRAAAEALRQENPVCSELAETCAAILEQLREQGYPPCQETIDRLRT